MIKLRKKKAKASMKQTEGSPGLGASMKIKRQMMLAWTKMRKVERMVKMKSMTRMGCKTRLRVRLVSSKVCSSRKDLVVWLLEVLLAD